MKLLAILIPTIIAQPAWAQLTIHVTPTASPQTTLADLKKNPNRPVTLTQALAILKDPTLRSPPAGGKSAARRAQPGGGWLARGLATPIMQVGIVRVLLGH